MVHVDKVSDVAMYPIKGCHAATVNGEVPESLAVGRTGFEANGVRDRDWSLFDPSEGSFVSQRGWGARSRGVRYPEDRQLATVRIDILSDHVAVTSTAGRLELPAVPSDEERLTLDILGESVSVVPEHQAAQQYFSALLGREVMLVRQDRDQPCELSLRYQRKGAFNQGPGMDIMPFLLTSEASLAAMHAANDMPAGAVPITRYRGNIVISGDGLGPYGEDYIDTETRFTIGDIGMWAVKACPRCPVTNIDQESGEQAGKGLRVLQGRAGTIFTGETGIFFGQYLIHGNLGAISVGDAVTVDRMMPLSSVELSALR